MSEKVKQFAGKEFQWVEQHRDPLDTRLAGHWSRQIGSFRLHLVRVFELPDETWVLENTASKEQVVALDIVGVATVINKWLTNGGEQSKIWTRSPEGLKL